MSTIVRKVVEGQVLKEFGGEKMEEGEKGGISSMQEGRIPIVFRPDTRAKNKASPSGFEKKQLKRIGDSKGKGQRAKGKATKIDLIRETYGIDRIYHVPGNPPSALRSQSRVVWVVGRCPLATSRSDCAEAQTMSTVKTPPVAGMSETSPKDVEKVERSSWANWKT